MKQPIILHRPDFCDICKKQAIEIFDYFNNPMRYSKIVDAYERRQSIDGLLDKRAIYRMRCRSCGHVYSIRWEDEYPLPDLYPYHKSNQLFLSLYHDKEKKG